MAYKVQDCLKTDETFLIDTVAQKDLRSVAQVMLNKVDNDRVLISEENGKTMFALISVQNKARDIFASLKQLYEINGGGSPKMVVGETTTDKETLIADIAKLL